VCVCVCVFSFSCLTPLIAHRSALQRMYAFWPQLSVQMQHNTSTSNNTSNNTNSSRPSSRGGGSGGDTNKPGGIVASFVWSDRYKIDRTFKEPQLYLPNANII